MNRLVIVPSVITVFVHVTVFIIESILWLKPIIHERALSKLNVPSDASYYEPAQILEVLFFNQGFYNLFVALGGIAGLVLYRMGREQEGIALVCYTSLFALGANLTLAFSTVAYPAAVIQGLPPALALIGIYFLSDKKKKGNGVSGWVGAPLE